MDEELTHAVRKIWSDLLGSDPGVVPIDTPFFDAGGDSRRLVVLYERLKALTDTPFPAAALFEHSTVRAQVHLLTGGGAVSVPEEPTDKGDGRAALLTRRADALRRP